MTLLSICMPSPTPLSVYKPFLMLIGQGTRILFAPPVLMLYILVKIPSPRVLNVGVKSNIWADILNKCELKAIK